MILFFIKDTKLYVTVVTLSEKKQLQMFERSMYWNEYNAKNENENTTNEYRYFLESKFIGVDRFFFFFWFIQRQMMQKGIQFKNNIYQMVLTSLSLEKHL